MGRKGVLLTASNFVHATLMRNEREARTSHVRRYKPRLTNRFWFGIWRRKTYYAFAFNERWLQSILAECFYRNGNFLRALEASRCDQFSPWQHNACRSTIGNKTGPSGKPCRSVLGNFFSLFRKGIYWFRLMGKGLVSSGWNFHRKYCYKCTILARKK